MICSNKVNKTYGINFDRIVKMEGPNLESRVPKLGKSQKRTNGVQKNMTDAIVNELGGPEIGAERMRERGMSPVEFAIDYVLGGREKAARLIGIAPNTLWRKMTGQSKWYATEIDALSQASGISVELLMRPAKPNGPPNDEKKTKAPIRRR